VAVAVRAWAGTRTLPTTAALSSELILQLLSDEVATALASSALLQSYFRGRLGPKTFLVRALRGEVWDKALAYCRQAGEKAMVRSAYREAVGYFEQVLSALTHLPETRDTLGQAIDLRLALRLALLPSGDSERILAYLREAEALARQHQERGNEAYALRLLGDIAARRGPLGGCPRINIHLSVGVGLSAWMSALALFCRLGYPLNTARGDVPDDGPTTQGLLERHVGGAEGLQPSSRHCRSATA
jgi:hypothetical protein